MDLRQLEYFVAIADLGSYSGAAKRLHVSQPALSKSIAALEAELEVRLFARLPRGVALTGPGRLLRTGADRIERELRNALAAVHSARGLEAGELDVACLATAAAEAAARLVGAFHQAYPNVHIKVVQPDQDHEVRALVSSGRCEIGFTDLAVAAQDEFHAEPLGDSRLLLVLPPGTAPPGESVSLTGLAEFDLVMGAPGTPARDLVDNALAHAGLRPRISVQVDRRDAIEHLVIAGAGASLLPERLAHSCVARGAVAVPLEPPQSRAITLITRRGARSPAAEAFVRLAVAG